MKICFLWQGLDNCTESVGSVLLDSLSDTAFSEFDCLSAFVSLSGITGLGKAIEKSKQHIKKFRVVVGIDQKGTSKEALEALLGLNIGTSIYYTLSPITYHPKVYIFKGDVKHRIIVGSSNLTKQGLFQNVEASLKVDFTKPDKDGEEFLKQTNSYIESFLEGKGKNLQKLTPELIQQLFGAGIIPNEIERERVQEDKTPTQKDKGETNKLDGLKSLFPTIELQRIPEDFKPVIPIKKEKKEAEKVLPLVIVEPKPAPKADPWAIKGKLLWKKSNLPASDVQHVKAGTAPTGGLRLTQSDWKVNGVIIDQTRYFRKDLFGKFAWKQVKAQPYVEIAEVKCYVKILGIDKGLHRFTLRHKPSGEAGQGNYTTLLSWGQFVTEITQVDLRGKNLYLYAPPAGQDEPFYIEIR